MGAEMNTNPLPGYVRPLFTNFLALVDAARIQPEEHGKLFQIALYLVIQRENNVVIRLILFKGD